MKVTVTFSCDSTLMLAYNFRYIREVSFFIYKIRDLLLLKVRTCIPAVNHRVVVSVSLMQYFVSVFFNVIYMFILTCIFCFYTFAELLTRYGNLYLKPSGNINRVLVARIIHTLMRGYCFQTDGLCSDMLVFFSKAMQYARYIASVSFVC